MRHRSVTNFALRLRISAFGLLAALLAANANAQRSPDTFTLPEPEPTQTPVPQGPADERAGVSIAPRAIPAEKAEDASRNSPPLDEVRAGNTSPADFGETFKDLLEAPVPLPTADNQNQIATTPTARDEPAASANVAPAQTASAAPLSQQQSLLTETLDEMSGSDEWVDIGPSIDLGPARPPATIQPNTQEHVGAGHSYDSAWLWGGLIGLVALLIFLGWRRWRDHTSGLLLLEHSVTEGARRELATLFGERETDLRKPVSRQENSHGHDFRADAGTNRNDPLATEPVAPGAHRKEPLAIRLIVTKATRSVMVFALDYRLILANRSDRALRDLSLSGQLVSAQRGSANSASLGLSQPLGQIARLGPSQTHTLTGTIRLPMVDVRMLKQGSVPVFIPLLHVTLEGSGLRARSTSFVIGKPSEASGNRLHPIALDTPPGSINGLRATTIRSLADTEPA